MIDENALSAAERLAMAGHNSRVAQEIRRISAAAHQRVQGAPAAAKTMTMTAADARADAAKSNAAADADRKKYEAEYQRDPKLQQEFGDVGTYCSYRRAETAGKVKIISSRVVRPGK